MLKDLRQAGIRGKGDERILGGSDFVENVLQQTEESFEEKYHFQARGYDFDRVVGRVADLMPMESEEVKTPGKSPQTVKARKLLCYWAHRKLGMTTIEIGKKLNLGQSAISRSSMKGHAIAEQGGFELMAEEKSMQS